MGLDTKIGVRKESNTKKALLVKAPVGDCLELPVKGTAQTTLTLCVAT